MTEKLYTEAELQSRLALLLLEVAEHEVVVYSTALPPYVHHECSKCGKFKEDTWQQHILSLSPDLDKLVTRHDAALLAEWDKRISGAVSHKGGIGEHGKTKRAIILDPFGGSGTVGRVATRLGRESILLDIGYRSKYAPLAVERNSRV